MYQHYFITYIHLIISIPRSASKGTLTIYLIVRPSVPWLPINHGRKVAERKYCRCTSFDDECNHYRLLF